MARRLRCNPSLFGAFGNMLGPFLRLGTPVVARPCVDVYGVVNARDRTCHGGAVSTLNGPGEGTWSVFAAKVVEERDRLRGVCDLRLHIMERLEKERDEARAQLAAIGTGAPCDGHRHCCADRRRLAEELLRVRAERDNAQLTFESCNRARRRAAEECDALKDKP